MYEELTKLPAESELVGLERVNEMMLLDQSIDFIKLWTGRRFWDLEIMAEGQRFKVHRALLSCRSSHFAKMLHSGMKEESDLVVQIKGNDPL